MLEVIALNVEDARAAQAGGADRIELVGTMRDNGLSPSVELVDEVLDTVDIPVRAMLRTHAGFAAEQLPQLVALARDYEVRGLDGLVLGFLDDGRIDTRALERLSPYLLTYTFHRAVDYADDYREAMSVLAGLSDGPTSVLTAGSPGGVGDNFEKLCEMARDYGNLMLVGGGLELDHIPTLRAAGLHNFHVGSRVRVGGSFESPVDSDLVATWARAVRD